MYWLDTMKDFRLYKNRKFLYPINNDKKFLGNLIFLNTMKKEESIDILKNSNISNKYTKCYYIEKNTFSYVKNIKKKKIINQNTYYKNVKESCKDIIKTYRTLENYNLMSTYYDLCVYNELFFENYLTRSKMIIPVYTNYLNHIMEDENISKYENKFLITEVGKEFTDFESFKTSFNNFLSILYNDIYFTPTNSVNYHNMTIIVLGKESGRYFKFNTSILNKKSLQAFKRALSIIIKLENGIELDDAEKKEDEISSIQSATKEEETEKDLAKDLIKKETNVKSTQEKEISMKVDEIIDGTSSDNLSDLETELNNNEEFLKFMDELKEEKITAEKASKNTARNELLKQQQKELKINNDENSRTLDEIVNDIKEQTLDKEILPIENKNKEELSESTLKDFEKSYNENLDEKDKMTILNNFSADNREIKLYVRNIKKENTSTPFNKKETWTIEFEDDRRVRHTVKVDFPIFINDKFLYLEGNKKIINKQLLLLPIVKTKPNEVQVVTNSNKTFIHRFGSKLSPKIEKFKKLLTENNFKILTYSLGDNTGSNVKFITNIEYDELASSFMKINIGSNLSIYFNQEEIRNEFIDKNIKLPKEKTVSPIGFKNNLPITYDMDKEIIYINGSLYKEISLIDFIIEEMNEKDSTVKEKYDNIKTGKKFIYSRCNILNKKIPLLVFLAYNEGLTTILNKDKINYELSDTRKRLTPSEKERKGCIPFKDRYLYYDIYPIKNSLLLNSLYEVNTQDYNFEEFDKKEVYLEIFFDLFGSRAIAKGFDNFYESFIDGITKEVLEDLNYPTDITGLFLYANALLQDNQYIKENDMSNYRLRSNEIVNVYFNKELEKAYSIYKNSVNGATPIKISIPQDAIIKDLKESQVLQDYDTLNPITETDGISTVTYKGPGGLCVKKNLVHLIKIILIAGITEPAANSILIKYIKEKLNKG